MKSIDFIGIGAAKSATSWIYQCLKEHPQACVSSTKETYFFSREKEYQKGTDYYLSYFKCSPEKVKGEFSADYLSTPQTPLRIKKHFPDAKIIVCLRNPIDRTYSHYYFDKVRGKREEPFEEALRLYPYYIDYSRYYTHLKKYLELFPNVLILIYEDIEKDPLQFIQKVYRFLEIDPSFVPSSLNQKINLTSKDKLVVPWLNDANFNKGLTSLKGNFLGQQFIKFLKATGLSKLIFFLKRKNVKGVLDNSQKQFIKPPMEKETEEYLKNLYENEIRGIEKITQRDLWRQ